MDVKDNGQCTNGQRLELEKQDQKKQYSCDIASVMDSSESTVNIYRSRDLSMKGNDESKRNKTPTNRARPQNPHLKKKRFKIQ